MEHWHETYTSDVDVYEAFSTAFDPEGRVWRRILETVPFAGKTVLEIGCGPGHYAHAIAPQTASYFALEIAEAMLDQARQRNAGMANLTFLHADAQAIPLPDASVDLVFGHGRSAPSFRGKLRNAPWARSTASSRPEARSGR